MKKKKDFSALDINQQVAQIQKALEKEVIPMLTSHGGGVEIYDIEGWDIHIRYYGACHGCPLASTGTLELIEQALRTHIDEQIRVVSV